MCVYIYIQSINTRTQRRDGRDACYPAPPPAHPPSNTPTRASGKLVRPRLCPSLSFCSRPSVECTHTHLRAMDLLELTLGDMRADAAPAKKGTSGKKKTEVTKKQQPKKKKTVVRDESEEEEEVRGYATSAWGGDDDQALSGDEEDAELARQQEQRAKLAKKQSSAKKGGSAASEKKKPAQPTKRKRVEEEEAEEVEEEETPPPQPKRSKTKEDNSHAKKPAGVPSKSGSSTKKAQEPKKKSAPKKASEEEEEVDEAPAKSKPKAKAASAQPGARKEAMEKKQAESEELREHFARKDAGREMVLYRSFVYTPVNEAEAVAGYEPLRTIGATPAAALALRQWTINPEGWNMQLMHAGRKRAPEVKPNNTTRRILNLLRKGRPDPAFNEAEAVADKKAAESKPEKQRTAYMTRQATAREKAAETAKTTLLPPLLDAIGAYIAAGNDAQFYIAGPAARRVKDKKTQVEFKPGVEAICSGAFAGESGQVPFEEHLNRLNFLHEWAKKAVESLEYDDLKNPVEKCKRFCDMMAVSEELPLNRTVCMVLWKIYHDFGGAATEHATQAPTNPYESWLQGVKVRPDLIHVYNTVKRGVEELQKRLTEAEDADKAAPENAQQQAPSEAAEPVVESVVEPIVEAVVEAVVEAEPEPVPARQDAMSEASDAAISSFPTMDMDLTQPCARGLIFL